MNLSPMRFKNYVWPHNPKVYEITYERRMVANMVPFGRYMLTNMGRTFRVLRGEGEFVGPGAYDEFKKLATVFYEETPGVLTHPVWMTTSAYFVALSLKQEPFEDYVSYSFEFWEDESLYSREAEIVKETEKQNEKAPLIAAERNSHTVKSGDTMWAIARKNGLPLSQLIALNPHIKNPNRIYPGDKIYLS